MAQTYIPIQTITVGSGGASSIDFINIPQNYTDLVVYYSTRAATSGSDMAARFNNDTAANYSYRKAGSNGSATSSDSASSQTSLTRIGRVNPSTTTANTFSNNYMYIPNYTSSNNKSVSVDGVSEDIATSANIDIIAGLWSNSAAITRVTLLIDGGGNFAQYSSATLYGVGGTRATGGTITADSTYTYHTFTSSGSFTTLENIKGAEVLLVAGGGGGGKRGAGGGAGGVLVNSGQNLNAANTYSVIVGAGGAGSTSILSKGANGSNSQFSSTTQAVGGGGGGSVDSRPGANGGSGGGGFVDNVGGSGTAGQGNNGGGQGLVGGQDTGAGGGGAGAAGGPGNSSVPGYGGIGTAQYSAWHVATNTGQLYAGSYYVGGGGGGAGNSTWGFGGYGGGASGDDDNTGNSGVANTGGGGGAGGNNAGGPFNGGAGGSGLVIIRYPN